MLDVSADQINILDIDHMNIGAYIRNTLKVDKNESRQDALFDIYRVMRPGEPQQLIQRKQCFIHCF